jgi:hypothetical protein
MISAKWLNLSNTKGGLDDLGIQVIQYDMNPQPLNHDELKKLKVGDELIIYNRLNNRAETVKVNEINKYKQYFWVKNSVIVLKLSLETGISPDHEWVACQPNVNKVQLKMADPGKFGVTPKRNLEPLSQEELKNLQVGDDILIYRQATDQIHHVKVFLISTPPIFGVKNDKIYAEFSMETGISLSKEWVACKPVETQAKAYTNSMSYDELNKVIEPKPPRDYEKIPKQKYHQILEPHFRFIRDENNHPYATICQLTIITPSQRIDRAIGIAVCSEKDQFNRQIGKQLAYKRAIIALNSKQNSYKINRTDSDRTYELMAQDYDYKSFYEEGL